MNQSNHKKNQILSNHNAHFILNGPIESVPSR